MQYLDYIYLKPGIKFGDNPQTGIDVEVLKKDGLMSEEAFYSTNRIDGEISENGISSAQISQMSLVLKKEIVDFEDHKIELNPEVDLLDPQVAVYEHLLKKTVDLIKVLGEANAAEISKKEEFVLDYEQKTEDTKSSVSRKILSKIMGASNMIAVSSRRGPGTFVIARKEIIDIISTYSQNTSSYVYPYSPEEDTFVGLKMFVCNSIGDTILVGRNGSDDEPGLRLLSNDESLENGIYFNNTDIAGVNVRYKLGSFSENDKRQYIAFKIKLIKYL